MSEPAAARMSTAFFGHGSPMIALETNATTQAWAALARRMGRPRAILCISAHWLTRGTAVTAMEWPRTIHDFGAFPQALFDVQYPAPGEPALAHRVAKLLAPRPVRLDTAVDESGWGLDHGAWSVLCKAYPAADVPVIQLSMDKGCTPAEHFEIGRRLRPLRDEGVLIIGTGNIVHNLGRMNWASRDAEAFTWARRFNDAIRNAIRDDRPEQAIGFQQLGEDALLSVPSPEHYWPLLYVLGARVGGDVARFGPDHIEHGSLSMTTVTFSDALAA